MPHIAALYRYTPWVACRPTVPAGGGVGSALVLAGCTYASMQAYYRGELCRPATLVSLGACPDLLLSS